MVENKCDYKFIKLNIGSASYRLPEINFNQPPFRGKMRVQKPKDVYAENPNLAYKLQAQQVNQSKKDKSTKTHIVCIPLNFDEIIPNYEAMVDKIKAMNVEGVSDNYFTSSNLLHVTLHTFNFTDDENTLSKAKSILIKNQLYIQQEILGACEGQNPKPFYLTLKGLKTFQTDDPTKAQVLYCDFKRDEGYAKLQKIASKIIYEFLNERIIENHQLKDIPYDFETELWDVKFHMTILKCYKSKNQSFNAKKIIDQLGDISIGVVSPLEVQLNNIHYIDTYTGKKIKRTEKGVNHDEEGFYACDAKIYLQNE
ncbi:activating signal cointegrator 1 complex subunit 1-like [Stylonychia lemnae]|uniref:Activating signal cointegrator 1 complex subunit 1-like n=1 Tax=Stylonychia lemnae TaxID=5949 RepID=A0A078AVE6_STYLE|nr:activating signal cointegrator 1 complex subunit 1-like [Stylonychia lemnae]|eukprot:CDW86355.1 activating signal cointegrator 1 complex subunit 1-like [Stylonychia lemnae]